MKYFTQDYKDLTDVRKIEVLVEELTKIVYYNDCDTEPVHELLNSVAELRQLVAK